MTEKADWEDEGRGDTWIAAEVELYGYLGNAKHGQYGLCGMGSMLPVRLVWE